MNPMPCPKFGRCMATKKCPLKKSADEAGFTLTIPEKGYCTLYPQVKVAPDAHLETDFEDRTTNDEGA